MTNINYTKKVKVLSLMVFLVILLVCAGVFLIYLKDKKSFSGVMVEEMVTNYDFTKKVDPKLVEAKGVEFGHAGRVWINSLNESFVYNKNGEIVKTKNYAGGLSELRVKADGVMTGLLFSPGHKFKKDAFIFPTEEGKVFGWHKGDDGIEPLFATERFSSPGAKFTSITSVENDFVVRIYLTDFKNKKILVLDDNYNPLEYINNNAFQDKTLPANFSPYIIKSNQENIFVIYLKKDSEHNPVSCSGCALVNVYTQDGKFVRRLLDGEKLNLPSAIVFPRREILGYKNTVLVGNGADGKINIFDLRLGKFIKSLQKDGKDLEIFGINSLSFGTGNGAGSMNDLFYTSFSDGKSVYGKIIIPASQQEPVKRDGPGEERLETDKTLIFEKNEISFQDVVENLQKGCISPTEEESYLFCLDSRLEKKIHELGKLLTKITNDLLILDVEFTKNSEGANYLEQNSENLILIKSFNIKSWLTEKEKECRLNLIVNYNELALEKSIKLCQYKAAENLLLNLYVNRADWIRYYVSDGSPIKNPVTDKFKILRDEEEFRANNSY